MSDYALENFKWGSSILGTPSGEVDWSFATSNFAGALTQFDSFLTGMFQTEVAQAFARWDRSPTWISIGSVIARQLTSGSDLVTLMAPTILSVKSRAPSRGIRNCFGDFV